MQKCPSLRIAALVAIAGAAAAVAACSKPSSPWNTARAVRVDTRDADDPSAVYAEHLSGVLKSANVKHKIVTYQYRYRTALREEAIGTRAAVIYRDESNPNNPWWLMDERLFKPVWLPGEDENRQVSFYLRRPATVVSTEVIDEADGKRAIGAPDAVTNQEGLLARFDAVRKTERSRNGFRWFAERRGQAQLAATPAGKSDVRRSAARPSSPPQSAASRYTALFRTRHGTPFDPASVTDRRKMEDLILTTGSRNALLF